MRAHSYFSRLLFSAQPGTMPTAPDSPSLSVTVSGNVQKHNIKKKKELSAEETELFEFTQAAGIILDQEVFKTIVDLLKMNVAPLAVFQTLKTMCAGQKDSETSTGDTSTMSHTTTAHSVSKEEECVVSGKSIITAAPPTASATRPPRGGSKIVVYSSGDTSAQVRSKTSSGQGEKTARDGSSQRVPRQVSATRGQKSAKSSGSSSSSSHLTSN